MNDSGTCYHCTMCNSESYGMGKRPRGSFEARILVPPLVNTKSLLASVLPSALRLFTKDLSYNIVRYHSLYKWIGGKYT